MSAVFSRFTPEGRDILKSPLKYLNDSFFSTLYYNSTREKPTLFYTFNLSLRRGSTPRGASQHSPLYGVTAPTPFPVLWATSEVLQIRSTRCLRGWSLCQCNRTIQRCILKQDFIKLENSNLDSANSLHLLPVGYYNITDPGIAKECSGDQEDLIEVRLC